MIEAVSGAAAGVFGTVLGYPLDSIKTRMQTYPTEYKTIAQSFTKIYSEEGLASGLYRGLLPPMTALVILNIMNFSVYSKSSLFLNISRTENTKLQSSRRIEPKVFIAGGASGVFAAFISTPFEFIKIQMQLNHLSGHYKGFNSYQTARRIVSSHGIFSLYKGHGVNTVREVCFLGTYFFTYEHCKSYLQSYIPLQFSILISGGLSGAIGWVVSYPLDCVKSKIQSSSLTSIQPSSMEVLKNLLHTKGISGLYNGVGVSVIRAFIVSSSRFCAYEFTKYAIS